MELNLVMTIVARSRQQAMEDIVHNMKLPFALSLLAKGTATTEHLSLHGLAPTEHALILTVADGEKTKLLMKSAKRKLFIDIPGNGVMMAYTRWGAQWSGANTNLIKGIMNGEWECNGLQITDNVLNSMVNGIDGVMGGTTTFDSMLAFMITGGKGLPQFENDPVAVSAMREACHHNLYAIANSQAMNGIGPDTVVVPDTPIIITICQILSCGFTFFAILFGVIWAVKVKKFKKTEEYTSYKEFKKALKNK